MSITLPTPVLVAAGLVGTGIDTLKRLPEELPALPVTLVGRAFRLSMRVQQEVAELAGRGEELLSGLTGGSGDESPSWARFDDDDDDAPTSAMTRPSDGGKDDSAEDRGVQTDVENDGVDDLVESGADDDGAGPGSGSARSGPVAGGPAQAPTVLPDLHDLQGEATGAADAGRTPSDSPAAVADTDGNAATRTRRAATEAATDPVAGGADALLAAAVGGEPSVATAPAPAGTPDAVAPSADAEPAEPGRPTPPAAVPGQPGAARHARTREPKPVPTSVDAVAPERRPSGLTAEDTARSAAAAARTRRAATTPRPTAPATAPVPPVSAGPDSASGDAAPEPAAQPAQAQPPESQPGEPQVSAGTPGGTGGGTEHSSTARSAEPEAMPGYGAMTVAQVRGHLGDLTAGQVADLLRFEQEHRGRAPFLTLLTNRITTLGQSAE